MPHGQYEVYAVGGSVSGRRRLTHQSDVGALLDNDVTIEIVTKHTTGRQGRHSLVCRRDVTTGELVADTASSRAMLALLKGGDGLLRDVLKSPLAHIVARDRVLSVALRNAILTQGTPDQLRRLARQGPVPYKDLKALHERLGYDLCDTFEFVVAEATSESFRSARSRGFVFDRSQIPDDEPIPWYYLKQVTIFDTPEDLRFRNKILADCLAGPPGEGYHLEDSLFVLGLKLVDSRTRRRATKLAVDWLTAHPEEGIFHQDSTDSPLFLEGAVAEAVLSDGGAVHAPMALATLAELLIRRRALCQNESSLKGEQLEYAQTQLDYSIKGLGRVKGLPHSVYQHAMNISPVDTLRAGCLPVSLVVEATKSSNGHIRAAAARDWRVPEKDLLRLSGGRSKRHWPTLAALSERSDLSDDVWTNLTNTIDALGSSTSSYGYLALRIQHARRNAQRQGTAISATEAAHFTHRQWTQQLRSTDGLVGIRPDQLASCDSVPADIRPAGHYKVVGPVQQEIIGSGLRGDQLGAALTIVTGLREAAFPAGTLDGIEDLINMSHTNPGHTLPRCTTVKQLVSELRVLSPTQAAMISTLAEGWGGQVTELIDYVKSMSTVSSF